MIRRPRTSVSSGLVGSPIGGSGLTWSRSNYTGSPRPFDPITGDGGLYDIWLSTAGITFGTGSAVASWTGRKAGWVATQGTASARPTLISSDVNWGNAPSLSFDGGDWLKTGTLSTVSAPFTVYCVGRLAVAGNNWICDFATRGSLYNSAGLWRSDVPTAGVVMNGEASATAARRMHCIQVAANGGTHAIYSETMAGLFTTADGTRTSNATHTFDRVTIGAYDDTTLTLRWNGTIVAVAVSAGLHNAALRAQYAAYFSGLYGL